MVARNRLCNQRRCIDLIPARCKLVNLPCACCRMLCADRCISETSLKGRCKFPQIMKKARQCGSTGNACRSPKFRGKFRRVAKMISQRVPLGFRSIGP